MRRGQTVAVVDAVIDDNTGMGFWCLVQGHLNMWPGGTKSQTERVWEMLQSSDKEMTVVAQRQRQW